MRPNLIHYLVISDKISIYKEGDFVGTAKVSAKNFESGVYTQAVLTDLSGEFPNKFVPEDLERIVVDKDTIKVYISDRPPRGKKSKKK